MKKLSMCLLMIMMMASSFLIPVESAFAASKPYLLIKDKNVVMDVGNKKQLSVSSNVKIKGITWSSSSSSIVSIDSKGVIFGKKAGAVTITAKDKKLKLSATAKVTVKAKVINITKISPSERSVDLTEGESTQVSATIQPSNATNKHLIWSSSDTMIASVEQDGTIYAHKKGNAIITISNESKSINAIISVKVEAIPVEPPVPPTPPVPTTKDIIKEVSKSVVYIEAYSKGNSIASGSGFVLTADGNIATNFHVITDDQSPIDTVKIKLQDGSTYTTNKVIGYDKKNDLAVLKIDNVSNLIPVNLGNSENIETGDKIITIGSPMGLDNTVSEGIISNIQRVLDGVPYIQITAPISHGSSGGVLVNDKGEVIGVTSAGIDEGQNLNFAIPINLLKTVVIGNSVSIESLQTPAEATDLLPGEQTIDEKEINDDPSQANIINSVKFDIYGSIFDNDDLDFYKFTITTPRRFLLITTIEDQYSYLTPNLLVGLFDSNGKLVLAGENYSDSDGPYQKIDGILQPGTYYLFFAGSEKISSTLWALNPKYYVVGGFPE
ncbi:MAG: trypsin-like peptidase domain-containing protein [Bacillota bacterium]|nr:trypsin-like peptidase domain-containing protein [Bacillota bacterium]